MESDQDAFVKASDYDLASQRHDHPVFVGRETVDEAAPWASPT